MSLKQNSIKATLWSAAQGWGGQLIGLLVFTLLARLLNPAAFGLVALAAVYVTFIQLFVEQGFEAAIVQRHKLDEEHLDTAFWTNLVFGISLGAATIGLSDYIALFFKQSELSPIIKWLSVSIVIYSLSIVQVAILKRNLQFRELAIRMLIAGLVGGAVGIAMALNGYGVWSLVGQQLVTAITKVVLLWFASTWRPKWRFSTEHFKDLIGYSANVLGINLFEFFNRYADNILIGYFLGPVALGYYALGYKVFQTLTQLLTGATSQVAFSSFSVLQKEPAKLRRAFYAVVGITAIVAFPVHMGAFAVAPELLLTVFGDKWAPSIPVLQVLCFAGLLESVYYFNASVMMAMGKPSWRLGINAVAAVCNIIGFWIAVHWGIAVVALAYVIRAYLLSPIPIILVKRLIDIDFIHYLRKLAPPLIASGIMVVAILIGKTAFNNWFSAGIQLPISIILGVLVYTTVLFALDRPGITSLFGVLKSIRQPVQP